MLKLDLMLSLLIASKQSILQKAYFLKAKAETLKSKIEQVLSANNTWHDCILEENEESGGKL